MATYSIEQSGKFYVGFFYQPPLVVTIIRLQDSRWRFDWSDTGAPYYRIVLDGFVLEQTTNKYYLFSSSGYPNYPPPIEVMSGNNVAPSEDNVSFLVMQWYRDTGAVYYQVQQFINSSWVNIKQVAESGSWVYTVRTSVLDDEAVHQFRVLAVDEIGQESDSLDFRIFTVRPPTLIETEISVGYDDSTQSIEILEV